MQTYTHAALGAALGAALFPDNLALQGACAVGAMIPDLVMVPQYLIDVANGRKPMTAQSMRFIMMKELSHSIPLWTVATLGTFMATWLWPSHLASIVWASAIGGLSHLPIDVLTHTSPRFAKDDLGMLWPFKTRIRINGWDYRKDYGDLTPKPFEMIILIVSLSFFMWR
jgi:hypothetical protein